MMSEGGKEYNEFLKNCLIYGNLEGCLSDCSLDELAKIQERITKAISSIQVGKACTLLEELKKYFNSGDYEKLTGEIQGYINQITNAGLRTNYEKEIGKFSNMCFWMKQFTKVYDKDQGYDVTDAYSANSFLNTVKLNFGCFNLEQIEGEFKDLRNYFREIVNNKVINTDEYGRYISIKKTKKELAAFQQDNKDYINGIYEMLYANDHYVYNKIFERKFRDRKLIYQKFTRAIMLLNGIETESILGSDNWKGKDIKGIKTEIQKRLNDMYYLCSKLSLDNDMSYPGSAINNNYIEPGFEDSVDRTHYSI